MRNRQEEIRAKGFNLAPRSFDSDAYAPSADFSKIKVGLKTLEDATINIDSVYRRTNPRLGDIQNVLRAIDRNDLPLMREISNYFYRVSGIYQRLCLYMSNLYRYDWFITPYINDQNMKEDKILDNFHKALNLLDDFGVKRFLSSAALSVMKNGCYYGYKIESKGKVSVQELPADYCRSRFEINGKPAVEFNMKFFDDNFRDIGQRMRVLNLFPKEFKKGYRLYKEGKLIPEFMGDTAGWYLLDVAATIKFNNNGQDYPMFISAIPEIIRLGEAQDLDRKKQLQRLLKIIIQKLPLDKNGDLIFDVDEARELHNNAIGMIGKAIGVDVLTTFADTSVEDMSSTSATNAEDDSMDRALQAIYVNTGTAENLFNTDGNIALEKSITNDEASIYSLLLQFESFLNDLISGFNTKPKKVKFDVQLLRTTIYNYKELAKLYKEQTQMGYSKMLPQIALGQSQSSVLANAYFENDILELFNVFIPPLTSNTMSSDALRQNAEMKSNKKSNNNSDAEAGRPEKADDEKSEKTIANKEAMS